MQPGYERNKFNALEDNDDSNSNIEQALQGMAISIQPIQNSQPFTSGNNAGSKANNFVSSQLVMGF